MSHLRRVLSRQVLAGLSVMVVFIAAPPTWAGGDWPRWRGPDGSGVSSSTSIPLNWSPTTHVRWRLPLFGEGSSSPIVLNGTLIVTSATDSGSRRHVVCIDAKRGRIEWVRTVRDPDPEITSALTGHAAATPAMNEQLIVASFGNAGLVALDHDGRVLWNRRFERLQSELGFASSPILVSDLVIQVVDHDGDGFRSPHSFLIALDVQTGQTVWKTERPGLMRSWSTPIVVPAVGDLTGRMPSSRVQHADVLVVSAQDEVRGYAVDSGKLLWAIPGNTGWVTPSPVWDPMLNRIVVVSGRKGPLIVLRPVGNPRLQGDPDWRLPPQVAWRQESAGPYVVSPLVLNGRLCVLDEDGICNVYGVASRQRIARRRLNGRFTASPIAVGEHLLATNENGTTFVLRAASDFEVLAENRLNEPTLASPAVAGNALYIRTEQALYCIESDDCRE